MAVVASGLPDAVIKARQTLLAGRQKIRAQHDAGSPGLQVCVRLTELVDTVLLDLYRAALADSASSDLENSLALVAHGGYGRRDVAPYSDVDLMLLHAPHVEDRIGSLARNLNKWIGDAGCHLGFSLRTHTQALDESWSDPTVFTSLAEGRFLAGNNDLFLQFMSSLRSGAKRRSKRLVGTVRASRRAERVKYGETGFLLQPNIKRSRGGLRDVQLVRWIGFALHGESDLDQLAQLGHLSAEDHRVLRRGYQYLLRLRNQMHFEAGKANDLLDRPLQMQLAQWSGCTASEGMLPVEKFMQEYFEHTSEIRYSSAHFAENSTWRSPVSEWFEHTISLRVAKDFRVGWRHVWASDVGLERLKRDPAAVLELMSISNRYGKPIEHNTWRAIRSAMLGRPTEKIEPQTVDRFMDLLSRPGRLAQLLKRLHELRVLEQIVPAMKHARCLLQFNAYHKYTVDAHCIRAVECATELQHQDSLLGLLYRGLRKKEILHLALLIHDLGKGYVEDHSEVGKRVAEETAVRLRLNEQDRETLVFLVHKHLMMSNIAFRYDLSDSQALVPFAATVGSSERLQMLLLLTYADLASVSPEVVNQWKVDLLLQLYHQTDSHFRDEKPGERFREEIRSRREQVLSQLPAGAEEQWWRSQVESLPVGYLMRTPANQVVLELGNLQRLDGNQPIVWGRFSPQQKAVEYTIALRQTGKPIGTFHRITGALSSQGMQILAAEIHTQPGEIAWDRFLVEDTEFPDSPPQARIDAVCAGIAKALNPANANPPNFPRIWRNARTKASEGLQIQPTQVRFDNSTSDKHTIITLFAYDRMGLLYDVSKVLFELQLVLHFAKIGTHLDQVVDVFYVTDLERRKIEEDTHLYMIRQHLLRAVGNSVQP